MGRVFFLPGEGDGILLYIVTYAHTHILTYLAIT